MSASAEAAATGGPRASLRRIVALASGGVRQAVRDKLLWVLSGFGLVLILSSVIVSQLTVGERGRIVMDLGLSASAVLGTLTAAFVTINQVAREIERKTIAVVLAKPVARWELVAGRFAGMAATLAAMLLAMGLLHAAVLVAVDGYRASMWTALALTWLETLIVTAVALLLSSSITPLPAMFLALAFVVIGHTSWGLTMLAERTGSRAARTLLEALYAVLPNLDHLNVRALVVWGDPIADLAFRVQYATGYCAVLLVLASALLARRDLA